MRMRVVLGMMVMVLAHRHGQVHSAVVMMVLMVLVGRCDGGRGRRWCGLPA